MNIGKELLVRFGLVAATVVAGLPFQDIETGQRAAAAVIFGNEVNCTDGVESTDPAYPYDAIVVPGAGTIQTVNGEFEPSGTGKMRLYAAAILYEEKIAPIIMLPNGDAASIEIPYLQRAYHSVTGGVAPIPEEAIFVGGPAINTAEEMRNVATMKETHDIHVVLVATSDSQRLRAVLFACADGVRASSVASEQVIWRYDPERADALIPVYSPVDTRLNATKEKAEQLLIAFDSKGAVPSLLRSFDSP